jgi:predicted RNase H-like HicB family nuclease
VARNGAPHTRPEVLPDRVPASLPDDHAAVPGQVLLEVEEPGHRVSIAPPRRLPEGGSAGYPSGMSTDLTWTVLFETVEDGWVQATVAELPGVITVGPTLAEARELLLDAVREYLLSLHPEPAAPVRETARREVLHVVIDAA